jgi:parafibromin
MASQAELDDPLYNLRLSITTSNPPILTTSATPSGPEDTTGDMARATYISFNNDTHHKTFPITIATRFAPDEKPIDTLHG